MPIFAVDDLSVAFGATTVVRGVSFSVEAGRTLAIVGESGSGKSVSLLGATGLLPPSAAVTGSVLHRGEQILGLPGGRLRRLRGADIGFVFQDPLSNLHPLKTVGLQIGEAVTAHPRAGRTRLGRRAVRERVLHLLDAVGIHNPSVRIDDYPRQFSGGMRQRVMIAIAIANNPGLIIADEPTTALDVTVQAAILDLLKRVQEEHRSAMIFVSHDLAVVSDIADDVLVMRRGEAVEKAPARAIYARPQHAYTRELLGAARLGALDVHAAGRADPPAADAPALLRVDAVSRSFVGRSRHDGALIDPVLQDISFSIRENEIVGLVGESGSGKSTIGRLIAGLDRPDAGAIAFRDRTYSQPGRDRVTIDRTLRSAIQVVFQDPYASLNPRRRIGAILAEPFLITGVRDRAVIHERVHELVRNVELPDEVVDRFPAQLSGGQRQRIAIARAIALQPSLIVADEPVSALDITTQRRIIALLKALRRRLSVAFLFISHDLGVVAELCQRVVVLERGRIVEAGDTAEVFGNPRHAYTRRLIDAVPGRLHADGPPFHDALPRKASAHV